VTRLQRSALVALVLALLAAPHRDVKAQATDLVCTSPFLRPGLLLRVEAPAPLDTINRSVIGPMLACRDGVLLLGAYPGQASPQYPIATRAVRRLWYRGNAGELGLLAGVPVGALTGGLFAAINSSQCTSGYPPVTTNCHGNVFAGVIVGGLIGGALGFVLGHGFPHWRRIFP
jgi:hypothetical protein